MDAMAPPRFIRTLRFSASASSRARLFPTTSFQGAARGSVTLNGFALETGDGASTEEPGQMVIAATQAAEAILFDLN
jgi:Quercetinase C-terminal cupin domain